MKTRMAVCVLVLQAVVCLTARVANADIEAGLVGYWPLDGDGNDASGNNLHGTINGDVTPVADREGNADSALHFPGASDSYVEIPDSPLLQLTGAMTLAAWVYLDATNTNNARIFAKAGGGGARSWSLNIEASSGGVQNPATFQIGTDNGATNVSLNDLDPLPTDEWVHIAGVYIPGEAMEVYVNGVLKGRNTAGIPTSQFSTNSRSARIGNRNDCGNCGWLGNIDEVRIYERALSPDEIVQVMLGSLASAGPDQTVVAGNTVTLTGSGPDDVTSWHWEQIAGQDRFTATLEPSADQSQVQFNTPTVEIGFLLTFELTAVSAEQGTFTDTVDIRVMAPNYPKEGPTNIRLRPLDLGGAGLGFDLEWDPIFDAEQYEVGLKIGDSIVWLETIVATTYQVKGLTEGQPRTIVIRARNSYGAPDPVSEPQLIAEVAYTAMRNLARPASLGGKSEPSGYVYVISHYA
ncbi:MAG: LamG-like jellyroll fold domain-containing protein, partial [bacterium]|nr:LamG-like jellyroll fold domain-containing protein [bacterium]